MIMGAAQVGQIQGVVSVAGSSGLDASLFDGYNSLASFQPLRLLIAVKASQNTSQSLYF